MRMIRKATDVSPAGRRCRRVEHEDDRAGVASGCVSTRGVDARTVRRGLTRDQSLDRARRVTVSAIVL